MVDIHVKMCGRSRYHAKINLSSAREGTASFGIQYEHNITKSSDPKIRAAGGRNNTVFLLENVMSHATEAGKRGKNSELLKKVTLKILILPRML